MTLQGRELPAIAILASGKGTTLEALHRATQREDGKLRARIGLVITNNSNAGVIERAERLGIPCEIVNGKKFSMPDGTPPPRGRMSPAESARLAELCGPFKMTLCSGYAKMISGLLLELWLLNHHPGPPDLTAGMMGEKAQQAVLDAGWDHTEITLHEVTEGYDEGRILYRQPVPVWDGDDKDTLNEALRDVEKRCVPYMLNSALHGDPYPPAGVDLSRRPSELYDVY